MTREEKIALAETLSAEGFNNSQIAHDLGVARSCVYRWLNPEARRRYNAATVASRRAPEVRARKQATDRAYLDRHRGTCGECGGPMGLGAGLHGTKTCAPCVERLAEQRRATIEALWAEGLLMREIADRLGSTVGSVNWQIAEMRAAGRNLPHRYNVRPRLAA